MNKLAKIIRGWQFLRKIGFLHMLTHNLPWRLASLATAFAAMFSLLVEPVEAQTNRFGFVGPEIFPIDPQIGQLRAADLDGDGLIDLVVVNNARSKINLLFNQTGKTNRTETVSNHQKRN